MMEYDPRAKQLTFRDPADGAVILTLDAGRRLPDSQAKDEGVLLDAAVQGLLDDAALLESGTALTLVQLRPMLARAMRGMALLIRALSSLIPRRTP